ncbi:hypothetical protein scyTo_0007925 [Scyliorhinus torazame]|uniref:Uncharacterized protein n=1 Tax=Scyliorhinus torazame TaxID=75743 RepID=A0A401P0S6_SCYTO|nr:hypothetical protein [Scyliorhinus torazame]
MHRIKACLLWQMFRGICQIGFNLTYTVSIGNTILKENTQLPGVIPIDPSSQTLIGPGQHNVTVHAANSTIETSQNLTIHLLLEISGLEAVIESPALQLGNNVSIIVSISQGSPITLQFDFIDAYNMLTYTVESANEKLPVYKFPMLKEGTFLVTVTASNTLSVVQLVVGHVTVTYDLGASAIAQDSQNTTTSAKRKRALPDNVKICTTRCPRPGTDATEILLRELPDSEELFRNKPKDYLEQMIEDILPKFTMIAMNSSSLNGVQKANTYLAFITSRTDALSVTSQERASNILLTLSDKLESFPVQRPNDIMWKLSAAQSGLYVVSNLLSASMSNKNLDVDKEKMENISEVLLTSIDKISFSLESQIHAEDPAYFFQTSTFNMVLNRYNPSNIKASRVETLEANPFSCTFTNSKDFQNISNKDFQLRMINFKENPFIWIEQSDINESMANISLSSNGIDLEIKNLSTNFEILLPRSNTSQLSPATYTAFMNPVIYMFPVTDTESAIVISIESKPVTSVQLYFSYGLFSTSILVLPNTVDVKDTVKLFSQIKDNSVVVSLLAAIFGVYIILVIWARMKDRQDLMKDIKRIARSLPAKVKDIIPTLEDDIKNADDMNKLLALVANIVQHCKIIEQAKSQEVAIPDNENDSPAACSPDEQNEDSDSMASNPDQPEENSSTSSSPDEERDQTVTHFFHYVNLLLKEVAYRKEKKNVYLKMLPSWLIYIAWLLVFITSGVSAFFTMLYSFDYGKEKSIQWLISMIISFIESVFVIQPIKVLLVAAFVALIVKKVERNENEESYNEDLLSTMHEDRGMTTPNFTNRTDAGIYNPPSLNNVEEMKALRLKEKKMYGFLKEIFAHVGFLVTLAIIAYGERSPHSFYLSKALNNSFTQKFNGSLTIDDIYIWTDEILLPNLYGVYEGFITDGNSKLLGSPRIRQVRVKPAPCPVPTRLVDSIKECRVPYSYSDEDMSVFGTKWNFTGNTEFPWLTSIWHYQNESQLNGYPIWGKLAVYRGGGFVAEIGTERKAAARMIKYLRDSSWVDMYTRAIFVEFTIYNANVNLFCVVTLMLEMKAIGVFLGNVEMEIIRLFHYVDQNYSSIIGAQIIFILIVIYYMVVQGKLLKQKRMKYFWDKWNLIDLAIILCSWSAFGLYIKRAVLGTRVINDYLQNRDRFINFYESAIIDAGLGYTIAFLVSLATVKLWKLLHLNPKMRVITSSLQRAWSNLLGLLVVLLVLLIAYSSLCYLVLGLNLSSYRTFSSSVITIIRLQMGTFNYDEVMRTTPYMGALIIGTCVIFIGFVLLNVLVSALLVSFSEERHHPLPREDKEIVDLLLMKLCNIIGIQRKMKKEQPSPEAGEMELLLEKEKL